MAFDHILKFCSDRADSRIPGNSIRWRPDLARSTLVGTAVVRGPDASFGVSRRHHAAQMKRPRGTTEIDDRAAEPASPSAPPSRARRWAAWVAVVAAVLTVFVAVNAGRPQPQPAGTPAAAEAPLVTRLLDQQRAGQLTPAQDDPISGVVVPVVAARPGNLTALGSLAIPAIKLTTAFYDGVYDEVLARGPGHWPGTPLPGQSGNSVLSGHRVTHTHPFLNLDRLRPGDVVLVKLGSSTIRYTVVGTRIVAEAGYVPVVLRQPADAAERLLTLFGCNPKHSHRERIVVQARAQGAGR